MKSFIKGNTPFTKKIYIYIDKMKVTLFSAFLYMVPKGIHVSYWKIVKVVTNYIVVTFINLAMTKKKQNGKKENILQICAIK